VKHSVFGVLLRFMAVLSTKKISYQQNELKIEKTLASNVIPTKFVLSTKFF